MEVFVIMEKVEKEDKTQINTFVHHTEEGAKARCPKVEWKKRMKGMGFEKQHTDDVLLGVAVGPTGTRLWLFKTKMGE